MAGHDIIVVGASAGGIEALMTLVRDLPHDIPAAVFIVLHIPPREPSLLPAILKRSGRLTALHPEDGDKINYGHMYIAPPDHHLLVEQGYVRVVRGPKENRHRPAVDPLFRSAARAYGTRVVGVVLTGALDDGTAGLLAVKRRGGVTVVQDPDEALYSGMPGSALKNVQVDYCLSLAKIGPLLVQMSQEPVPDGKTYPIPEEMEKEVRIAAMETNALNQHEQVGTPSAFSCPDCGGVLWEIQDGDILRFRCRTGHAFSPESVLAEQSEELEKALWAALKTLEEKVSLSQRIAQKAHSHGHEWLARSFEEKLREANGHAMLLRKILLAGTMSNDGEGTAEQDAHHSSSSTSDDAV